MHLGSDERHLPAAPPCVSLLEGCTALRLSEPTLPAVTEARSASLTGAVCPPGCLVTYWSTNISFFLDSQFHSKMFFVRQIRFLIRNIFKGFPGGAVVKNPSANAGDAGLSPGPGRSHMPRSN